MSIPTRTQISNYATQRGLKVKIIGPHKAAYMKGTIIIVKFDHPPSSDDGRINFRVRQAMSHALDTDGGVLYGPNLLVFYKRNPPVRFT